jgi:hypothetical protein
MLWGRYLKDWTFWNHIRTAASIAAVVHILDMPPSSIEALDASLQAG